ncbi:MAG: glycosyltransferase family 4 protein [Candidatus Paceibacterota bacterium]|jgi:glycosyltransferase involved in cell wall biosynthesis
MRILIASGIYPPDIGGPAQYARNLYQTWKEQGHDVKVAAYRWERALPPGVRHFLYFLKILRKGWNADLILVLDTWSAAVPAMYACKIMRKKYILRTGGDFLWETYTERTADKVLFRDFYDSSLGKLSRKEKTIFRLGGKALRNAGTLIFSTDWQRKIFEKAYKLDPAKSRIVENFVGERPEVTEPENRSFVGATRQLTWKNIDVLKSAFEDAKKEVEKKGFPEIDLDLGKAVYDSFFEKIRRSYAVILVSLGDISPNMIFDAIRAGTPFIVTKENGITDRIRECAIFVDPQNPADITSKIVWLADPANRTAQAQKVRNFSFVHTWSDIANEIAELAQVRGKK